MGNFAYVSSVGSFMIACGSSRIAVRCFAMGLRAEDKCLMRAQVDLQEVADNSCSRDIEQVRGFV
jgi:hypothetical protein